MKHIDNNNNNEKIREIGSKRIILSRRKINRAFIEDSFYSHCYRFNQKRIAFYNVSFVNSDGLDNQNRIFGYPESVKK